MRAAAGESPYTSIAAADIQYESGGFSRKGVSASWGSVRSLCRLIRQEISASRGSSGVHALRHKIPMIHKGASARTTTRGQRRTLFLVRDGCGHPEATDYAGTGRTAPTGPPDRVP